MKTYFEPRIYLRGLAGSDGEFYEIEPVETESEAREIIAKRGQRARWELFRWEEDEDGEPTDPELIDSNC